jgi:hypothetical protein
MIYRSPNCIGLYILTDNIWSSNDLFLNKRCTPVMGASFITTLYNKTDIGERILPFFWYIRPFISWISLAFRPILFNSRENWTKTRHYVCYNISKYYMWDCKTLVSSPISCACSICYSTCYLWCFCSSIFFFNSSKSLSNFSDLFL